MKYAAALLLIALVACTSQPVTKIGVGGVWNTQDHQAVGGHSGNAGSVGGRGGRGAASGGMGRV
jgi:hypothetical protein